MKNKKEDGDFAEERPLRYIEAQWEVQSSTFHTHVNIAESANYSSTTEPAVSIYGKYYRVKT